MTIVYSCVASGNTVLCSHQIGAGSFESVVESILRNIPTRNDGKTTYSSDNYMFHCVIANGIIFLCAAKADFGKKQPYAFLAEIKRKFQSGTMAMRAVTPRSHELDAEFGMVLAQDMEKFSKPASNDNLSMLRSQVDEVKDVMTQNIEKVLERGERLDDLVDKTNDLEASAQTFQKTATKLRRKYWWKNTKMMLILGCVIFIVLVIIVVLILYGAGVFSSSDSSSKTTPAPRQTTVKSIGG